VLGLKWGQRAKEAAPALGLECGSWQPWPDMSPYEVCHAGPLDAFGLRAALITFVRKEEDLAGVQLIFKDCIENGEALRAALAKELKLGDEVADYRTWQSGEVLRIEMHGSECTVTVTDAALGKAYQKHRLRGWGGVGPR
jgi:hypothetical protein